MPVNPGVDSGEASVLALASNRPGSLLIMDDRAGRAEAKTMGLTVIGTAAVVSLAREQGLIESAKASQPCPLRYEPEQGAVFPTKCESEGGKMT